MCHFRPMQNDKSFPKATLNRAEDVLICVCVCMNEQFRNVWVLIKEEPRAE